MRNIIFTLLLSLFATTLSAQDIPATKHIEARDSHHSIRPKHSDSNIFGHVIDATTKEHIPYATITIEGTTIGCAADGTGHYNINNIPLGEHKIVVSAIGYNTITLDHTAKFSTTTELNFSLKEATTMVDEVVVSATRNETNRRKTATVVNVASTKLFEGTASSNLSDAMNFQSGLRVETT
ncbi:MAG: carboxypeptidase-like regulatory domain-containing protein, partial [Alistipes sp.]|nr:carboxypeptidase-like regulatory domain-containing protein [Alistipes sp.]